MKGARDDQAVGSASSSKTLTLEDLLKVDKLTKSVKELFEGHHDLISGFNAFLPKDKEINLANRFRNEEHVYASFIQTLNNYRREAHKTPDRMSEVITEVSALFDGHPDLIEEFLKFVPF